MRPKTRQRLRFALLTSAGLLFMAEAAVSVFGKRTLLRWQAPVPVTTTGAPYLPGNPYLLWEMVPGERQEMGVSVHVNDLGFRGPETTAHKPPKVRRIIIVGDSSVYGHGVGNNETFSALMDDSLPADVEVLNLGVPGYSTEQTINLMEMRGWDLSPDLLIIGNMWSDNNFDSFVDRQLISDRTAFKDSPAAPISRLLQNSALYRWMDWYIRLAPRAADVQKIGWMLGQAPAGVHRRVNVNDYAENLQTLSNRAQGMGADVLFLGLSNTVDVGADTDGAIAWPLYREVMQDSAQRAGAPYVDVTGHFIESGKGWQSLFLDEMHPSAEGHKAIAEALLTAVSPWVKGDAFGATPIPKPNKRWDDPFSRGEGPAPKDNPVARVTIKGTVLGAPEGMPVQIDLVNMDPKRDLNSNPMLGSARFDHVDTFEMPAPPSGTFGFRLYLDKEADGPTKGDAMITLYDHPIQATGNSLTGVVIDLNKQSVSLSSTPTPTNPVLPSSRDAADK